MDTVSIPTRSLSLDLQGMAAIFGEKSKVYGLIVNDIAPDLVKDSYSFEDLDEFKFNARDRELVEITQDAFIGRKCYTVRTWHRSQRSSGRPAGSRWRSVSTRQEAYMVALQPVEV